MSTDVSGIGLLGKVFGDPPFPIDENIVLMQPFSLTQVSSLGDLVTFDHREREDNEFLVFQACFLFFIIVASRKQR